MKTIIVSSLIIFSLAYISCSEEDDWEKLDNLEHKVTIKLFSNTPGVPMTTISGLIVKDYWEYEIITKDYFANYIAYCSDPTVLMILELYVNGKLKARSQGDERVELRYRLKGDGY